MQCSVFVCVVTAELGVVAVATLLVVFISAVFCVCVYSNDAAKFREDLMNIARTTLSSKILTQYKDHFANLAVTAVLRLKVTLMHCHSYIVVSASSKTDLGPVAPTLLKVKSFLSPELMAD